MVRHASSSGSVGAALYEQRMPRWNRFIKPVLAWLDRWGWTANTLTSARFVFVLPVCALLYEGHIVFGGALWIFAMTLDGFDGPLARYQDDVHGRGGVLSAEEEARKTLLERIRFKGSTALGGILDAIADKLLMIAVVLPIGARDLLRVFLEIWIAVAIALTLLSVVLWLAGIPKPGANWFGKKKIWVEAGVVAALGLPAFVNGCYGLLTNTQPPHNILIHHVHPFVSNTVLLVAIVFGLLSFSTHLFRALQDIKTRST